MRWIAASLLSLGALGLGAVLSPLGCGSAHAPTQVPAAGDVPQSPPPEPEPVPDFDHFSASRAFADLGALVALGPRPSGSDGAAQARSYLRGQLEALGLAVEEIRTPRPSPPEPPEGAADAGSGSASMLEPLRHLSVTLPGESPARFLLTAPYDSSRIPGIEYLGANDAASGAALLLELARVLSHRSLRFTTQLLFVDGDGRADASGNAADRARWQGSASLAAALARGGELDSVRLLVAFHQVCDADLRIARDLSSHRMYREEFFRAADRTGHAGAFPRDQGFESVEIGHLAFRDQGVRGAVAITDTHYGGDSSPGLYAESQEDTLDHCAPESLEAVGAATLDALETIAARLAKIDRFSRSPVSELESLAPDAEPQASPRAGDQGDQGGQGGQGGQAGQGASSTDDPSEGTEAGASAPGAGGDAPAPAPPQDGAPS